MRYLAGIDSTMRVVIKRPAPLIYQIVSGPAEIGRRVGLEIMAERYSTEGA